MRLFGLIGYPLTHSFSKRFFDDKFEKENLSDCRFENFSIADISLFPSLLQHSSLKGLAVTIPYKQQVMQYLTSIKNIPEGLSACNCIKVCNEGLLGFNTDWIGFEKSFKPLLQTHHTKALVLGNGGATEAVQYVLKKNNIAFEIVSRKKHGNSTLTYEELNKDIVAAHSIIINTTPVGMYPKVNDYPLIPYDAVSGRHLLYDLVYNPETTNFLAKGKERGAIVKNGSDMLLLQAEENWKIWNE